MPKPIPARVKQTTCEIKSELRRQNNFGGSLLPSHGPGTYNPLEGAFGTFKVVALLDVEEHALMYEDNRKLGFSTLAVHPNGYSCKELADRILQVWGGKVEPERALAQFDFILDCGGLGKRRSAIEHIVNQQDPQLTQIAARE